MKIRFFSYFMSSNLIYLIFFYPLYCGIQWNIDNYSNNDISLFFTSYWSTSTPLCSFFLQKNGFTRIQLSHRPTNFCNFSNCFFICTISIFFNSKFFCHFIFLSSCVKKKERNKTEVTSDEFQKTTIRKKWVFSSHPIVTKNVFFKIRK